MNSSIGDTRVCEQRAVAASPNRPHRPHACEQGCAFFKPGAVAINIEGGFAGPIARFSPKATIFAKGDRARHCYKVVEGAVRLAALQTDGRRQVLEFLLPNDPFGIETTETYTATAEAIGDVTLLRCPRSCIAGIQENRPDARAQMMGMLSRCLGSSQEHVVLLGHQSAKQRVASFLLRLMEKTASAAGQRIELPVGRQDVADYLGLTIETTCRALSEFKAAGIVSLPNRRQVAVRKLGSLQAIAESGRV